MQQQDLIILVPDKHIEFSLKGILARHQSLGLRQIESEILVHPHRDPGCLRTSQDLLQPFVNQYRQALIIFDRDGCGREQLSREQLEQDVEQRLAQAGWQQRAAVIVLDPEIEVWVWSGSPHVATVLGWEGRTPDLRTWLIGKGLLDPQQPKPTRPKEALELALREVRRPHSSALFLKLAERVGYNQCVDPAFSKLKATLQQWFSALS